MRIRLTIEGQTATATLNDTPTARDFASLLPLALNMHDLFGREKPGQLARPLTPSKGQATYQVSDLGYWAAVTRPGDLLRRRRADNPKSGHRDHRTD